MKENQLSLQQSVLDTLRGRQTPVTAFLLNGVKLQGYIGAFDDYAILLVREGEWQLVYKRAISTVVPSGHLAIRPEPPHAPSENP